MTLTVNADYGTLVAQSQEAFKFTVQDTTSDPYSGGWPEAAADGTWTWTVRIVDYENRDTPEVSHEIDASNITISTQDQDNDTITLVAQLTQTEMDISTGRKAIEVFWLDGTGNADEIKDLHGTAIVRSPEGGSLT